MLTSILCCVILLFAYSSVGAQYSGIYQGELNTKDHDVRGKVYIADDRTFIVKNFHYDGTGPDAYFWVDRSTVPTTNGEKAPLVSKPGILGKYSGQDVVVKLPSNYQMSDVKSFSVWCEAFAVNFGDLNIEGTNYPKPLEIGQFPPGSAHEVFTTGITILDDKTIKVSGFKYDGTAPDAYFLVGKGIVSSSGTKVPVRNEKAGPLRAFNGEDAILDLPGDMSVMDIAYLSVYCYNVRQNFGSINMPNPSAIQVPVSFRPPPSLACRSIFKDKFNVYWRKEGNENVVIMLEGKVKEFEYLAFGVSGSTTAAQMEGGDVFITYSRNGQIVSDDYYLNKKEPCTGVRGVCPDVSQGGSENYVLVNKDYNDGILRVKYKRPITIAEDTDKPISTVGQTSMIAAIGGVDDRGQIKFHSIYNKDSIFIDFNDVSSSCSPLESESSGNDGNLQPWAPTKISGQRVFRVQLGVTGGSRGYQGITGKEGWGIAFYVNGLLIPELVVTRGIEYTFIIEAGNDTSNNAKNHPVYITTNPDGGSGAPGAPSPTGILAGAVKQNDGTFKTYAGRLCMWKEKGGSRDAWKNANSFQEYKDMLELDCQTGNPKSFSWTPDKTIPDTVYYQCWIHRNLGWKISVTDIEANAHRNAGSKAAMSSMTYSFVFWSVCILKAIF